MADHGFKSNVGGQRLQDAERPGAPAEFTMEQVLKLFAMACDPPEVYGYPISHWTARELATATVQEGIVTRISPRHVGRLLAEADLKPHQSHCGWVGGDRAGSAIRWFPTRRRIFPIPTRPSDRQL
jgi:hypothetical protein